LNGFSKVDFPWLTAPVVLVSVIALLTPLLVPFEEPDKQTVLTFPNSGTKTEVSSYVQRLQLLALSVGTFSVIFNRFFCLVICC
jgi:hypothetical protein